MDAELVYHPRFRKFLFIILILTINGCSQVTQTPIQISTDEAEAISTDIEITNSSGRIPLLGFAYGPEEALRVADLGDKDLVELADYIMSGRLYSDSTFEQDPTYETEPLSINWDIQHSKAPSSYNLGLHTLNMVGFLSYGFEETGNKEYLWRARHIIEDYLDYYEGDEISQYVWYDHSVASRVANLVFFLSFAESVGTPIYESDFIQFVIDSLQIHAEWLYDNNNYQQNNNHGIMADRSLIALSLFIESDKTDQWLSRGLSRLRAQFTSQFTNEAVHVENSPYYAIGVIEWFIDIEEFLNQFGYSISPAFEEWKASSIRNVAFFMKPDRSLPRIGDTFAATPITHLPGTGNEAIDSELSFILSQGKEGSSPSETRKVFPAAGYAIMRSVWSAAPDYTDTTWLIIKSGYIGGTAHKHNDDLTFSLYAQGQDIITDSGVYSYERDDPMRQYMLSSLAHNTMIVDGIGFEATTIKDSQSGILEWEFKDSYDRILAHNDLYDGVSIDRHLYFIRPNVFIIVDDIVSDRLHSYSQLFHLDESVQVEDINSAGVILRSSDNPGLQVAIQQIAGDPKIFLHDGENEGSRFGFISSTIGEVRTRKTLEYVQAGINIRFYTLISIGKMPRVELIQASTDQALLDLTTDGRKIVIPIHFRARMPSYGASGIVDLLGREVSLSAVKLPNNTYRFTAETDELNLLEYAWYIYKDGALYEQLWYQAANALEYTFPEKGSYRIQVFIREQVRNDVKATDDFGGVSIFEDMLRIDQMENDTFEFDVQLEEPASPECAWYFYKNDDIYDKVWYTTCEAFQYKFEDPGEYHLTVFVRQNSELEPGWIYSFDQVPIHIESP